jgi:metal-responsive CopG/Arc/MetJ family transcriptional regulator
MARASEKVAISLDQGLFERAERLRKASGETRSALVARALRQLLRDESQTRAVAEYVEAYLRIPETATDERRARALTRKSMTALAWDDE